MEPLLYQKVGLGTENKDLLHENTKDFVTYMSVTTHSSLQMEFLITSAVSILKAGTGVASAIFTPRDETEVLPISSTDKQPCILSKFSKIRYNRSEDADFSVG